MSFELYERDERKVFISDSPWNISSLANGFRVLLPLISIIRRLFNFSSTELNSLNSLRPAGLKEKSFLFFKCLLPISPSKTANWLKMPFSKSSGYFNGICVPFEEKWN